MWSRQRTQNPNGFGWSCWLGGVLTGKMIDKFSNSPAVGSFFYSPAEIFEEAETWIGGWFHITTPSARQRMWSYTNVAVFCVVFIILLCSKLIEWTILATHFRTIRRSCITGLSLVSTSENVFFQSSSRLLDPTGFIAPTRGLVIDNMIIIDQRRRRQGGPYKYVGLFKWIQPFFVYEAQGK